MHEAYDIYRRWIVAFVDGSWRHVRIADGFFAVAPHREPNQHIGVFRQSCLRPGIDVQGDPIGASQFALVGAQVTDEDVLGRIAFVRFGRTGTVGAKGVVLPDGSMKFVMRELAVNDDLDDCTGVNPQWPHVRLPTRPSRWERSARSLEKS